MWSWWVECLLIRWCKMQIGLAGFLWICQIVSYLLESLIFYWSRRSVCALNYSFNVLTEEWGAPSAQAFYFRMALANPWYIIYPSAINIPCSTMQALSIYPPITCLPIWYHLFQYIINKLGLNRDPLAELQQDLSVLDNHRCLAQQLSCKPIKIFHACSPERNREGSLEPQHSSTPKG